MSVARARVTKLEAAMAAVGETDPTFTHLQEALKKAKAQCQVRPVEDRIASSKEFIERAKKRIVACQAEVSEAQEALAKAQSKLQQEEQGLTDGEARLAILLQESAEVGPQVEVPPTVPANFAQELVELRACLSEFRRENSDLHSQLLSGRSGEERERKHPRNLASSTLDLVPLNRTPPDAGVGVGQSMPLATADASLRMETLIDNAEASLRSNRFNPLSG